MTSFKIQGRRGEKMKIGGGGGGGGGGGHQ